MPASKALETLLVCTCLAQSALSNNVNDDFVCDKVEKKSPWIFGIVVADMKRTAFQQLRGYIAT